jgi:uncharacterized repeat protein (TIGR01451 family)
MKTPNFSKLLQLGGNRYGSKSDLTESANRAGQVVSITRLGALLAFLMIFSTIFTAVSFSVSPLPSGSAQSRANLPNSAPRSSSTVAAKGAIDKLLPELGTPFALPGTRLSLLPALPPGTESIGVFAADCTTPQTDFDFTETVCVKVTNAPTGGIERLIWGHTDGRMVRETSLVSAIQTDTMLISPTTLIADEVVNNRGTWRVSSIDTDFAPVSVAYFTIHDPATPTGDLNVFKYLTTGNGQVNEDSDATFAITVANQGPDTAKNVHLADSTPSATTFVSLTQTSGPEFICSGSNCAIANLAKGAQATFTAVYHTNGVASPTVSSYTAAVSSEACTSPCSPAGPATAELRPADNTASGEFTINVTGVTTACTLNCSDNVNATANATVSGVRGAHVTFSAAEPEGDCGAVTATPASGSFFPVGTTTVSVGSATGGGSCSFTVTVEDTGTNPATISCPASIEDNAGANCGATVSLGTPSTTGDNVTVVGSRSDGLPLADPFAAGITTVTWTAYAHNSGGPFATPEDEEAARTSSASCTQLVTVTDVTAPAISGSPQTASADASCMVAIPDFTATATVSDNCACADSDQSVACEERNRITVTQAPAAGTMVGLGPHTITLTANDGSSSNNGDGNTTTTTTTFTVNDTTAPTVSAPADSSASANSSCQAAVPDYTAGSTAADNCGTPTVTQSPAAGTLVGPGPHTVTVTATDGAGLTGTDTVVFTVNDTTAPVITLNGASTLTVECHTSFTDPGATASDSCDSNVPVTAAGSVNVNVVGTYTLTYNASDDSGNPAAQVTRTVNVVDTTAPVISCPANVVVYLPANSSATSMAVNYSAVTATESCSTATVNSSPASGSVFPVGTTTVNATATDAAGNSSSCSFTVTVLYNFTGFFSPVSNVPTLNSVNAGKAVPVKFSLSGGKGLNIFAVNNPYSISLNCSTNDPGVDVTETLNAGGSSLSYDPDQYIYVWKTESSWAGTCRQLVLTLNDGSVHVANFKFK